LAKQAAQTLLRRLGLRQVGGLCLRRCFALLPRLRRRLALRLLLGLGGRGLVIGLPSLAAFGLQLGPSARVVAVVQHHHLGIARARQQLGHDTQTLLRGVALRARQLLGRQAGVERQHQSAHG
jgi:hypothetical protein